MPGNLLRACTDTCLLDRKPAKQRRLPPLDNSWSPDSSWSTVRKQLKQNGRHSFDGHIGPVVDALRAARAAQV